MNLKLDSSVTKVKFNGSEVDKVKYNGSVVWSKPTAQHIYGVAWPSTTGTDTQILIRTDDAANFANPVPYINNDDPYTHYSSPFDNCYPWNLMTVETVNGDVMVKIPKFWYKMNEGSSYLQYLQIADYPAQGFKLSPAHIDKGYGEQDYIYVSRYMANEDYKSKTKLVVYTETKDNQRTGVRNKGIGYELFDWALWQTLWMLYLVEFANTDSCALIGLGSNPSSPEITGDTDTMPYHTGTMGTSITDSRVTARIQYRNIEDIWGNAMPFIDGVWCNYNSSSGYKLMTVSYKISDYTTNQSGGFNGIHGTKNIKALTTTHYYPTVDNTLIYAILPIMGANQTIYNYVPETTFTFTSKQNGYAFIKNSTGLFGGNGISPTLKRPVRFQYLPFATSA